MLNKVLPEDDKGCFMLEKYNKRDKPHLINLIARRCNTTPNFALLIGAGASSTSNVKTTTQMIAGWRQHLYGRSKSDKPFEEWLQTQDWYGDEEEYSILFEKVYDQPSQRRNYIEECVKDAEPSWGYIYLANIIAHNYFNVIFTPNFDDVLNEACFIHANLRPIVCSHDSAVAGIRITSARPKIIKLHGDFLYDSIKNTLRETESLEKNMRDKFMEFGREYGLVLIGYDGNDKSIIDILETMVGSEGYLPNGLYWYTKKGDKVNKKLKRLLQRERTYWVEIDGFDEFMAELHEGLKLTLPDTVRDAYKATTEKLNNFISAKEKITHPIIKKDISELETQVKKFEQVISRTEVVDELVPYKFLGDAALLDNDYETSFVYYEKALVQNPTDLETMEKMNTVSVLNEQFDKALNISEEMLKNAPADFRGYRSKGYSLIFLKRAKDASVSYDEGLKYAKKGEFCRSLLVGKSNALLIVGEWKEALSAAEKALQINAEDTPSILNMCTALKKLSSGKYEKILRDALPKIKNRYYRACAFAILEDKENMLKELKIAIKEEPGYKVITKFDPEFADYQEDPDYQKLVHVDSG